MITIERIVVGKGRMSAFVALCPSNAFTTPELMQRVLSAYPRLARHSCVNAKGPTFADVMDNTSWAHVLEHLVIDLQVSAHERTQNGDGPWFVGNTQWVDQAAGRARVQVNFHDDLVALASFKQAVLFLNELFATRPGNI